MPLPSSINDLSQTAGSNSPSGSEAPSLIDDYLRTYAAYIALHRDGRGFALEASVPSAATCDIGAANSLLVQITGTTGITSFGTTYSGPRIVRFAAALTLTHSASLVLPGAANITTAAGDALLAIPNGNPASGYRVVAYHRASGAALVASVSAATETSAGVVEISTAAEAAAGIDDTVVITPAKFDARLRQRILPITASVAGNALTLTLNPTVLDFRSATLGSGVVNTRAVASAISLVISSGSTLGTISGQASRIAVLAIDNAGTVELAAVNLAGGVNLDETGVISTTAEGGAGAADSATVIYSTTARTNVPYRVVGYVESTQATAGTWATAPSTIQGAGGQALATMQSLGFGQTYQSVTRTSGVTYYNTTGKPIFVVYNINGGSASAGVDASINGGSAIRFVNVGSGTGPCAVAGSIVIPVGASYVFTETGVTSRGVFELR